MILQEQFTVEPWSVTEERLIVDGAQEPGLAAELLVDRLDRNADVGREHGQGRPRVAVLEEALLRGRDEALPGRPGRLSPSRDVVLPTGLDRAIHRLHHTEILDTGQCIERSAVRPDPLETIERIRAAISDHDLDALERCFAEDYVNETPIHPSRGFQGRNQVRKNWQRIFSEVPDIAARVTRRSSEAETAWSEWEMRGTRHDGSSLVMRGVGIFGVRDGQAQWCRFYLDVVDEAPIDIDRATAAVVRGAEGADDA